MPEPPRMSTYERLAKVVAEVKPLVQESRNTAPGSGGYKYTSTAAVYAAVGPLLGKQGVTLHCRQTAAVEHDEPVKFTRKVQGEDRDSWLCGLTLHLEFAWAGPDDTADTLVWLPFDWRHVYWGNDPIKATGAALSYARRYFLVGALLIGVDDGSGDPDANGPPDAAAPRRPAPKKPAPKKPAPRRPAPEKPAPEKPAPKPKSAPHPKKQEFWDLCCERWGDNANEEAMKLIRARCGDRAPKPGEWAHLVEMVKPKHEREPGDEPVI